MRKIRTHTFRGRTYRVDEPHYLGGVVDLPDSSGDPEIVIVWARGIQGLDNALHEALHAIGVPDEYLHDKEGYAATRDVARFLWRLGYRRKG